MDVMNRKSFWTYSLWGLGLAGIALIVFSYWIAPEEIYANPEYKSFSKKHGQYQTWVSDHQGNLAQSRTEQVIAGLKPHTILRGSELEGIAFLIRALGMPGNQLDSKERAALISELFVSRVESLDNYRKKDNDGRQMKDF